MRAAHSPVSNTGSALHYLPADGAELTFPMLQFSLLGAICMLGTLWLVVRARSSVRAGALAIGVLAVYLWSLLSMLTTLARTTLLSFRLQPTLTRAARGRRGVRLRRGHPGAGRHGSRGAWSPVAGGDRAGRGDRLQPGHSRRAAARPHHRLHRHRRPRPARRPAPAGSEKYYSVIDAAIQRVTGKPRDQTVVLTADYSFLSYYPYWGFQGLTSHYANPLAQFDLRAAQIKKWSELKTADEFIHALDTSPWPPPTVFLMRRGCERQPTPCGWPRTSTPTSPTSAATPWTCGPPCSPTRTSPSADIGPFVLAIRKPAA